MSCSLLGGLLHDISWKDKVKGKSCSIWNININDNKGQLATVFSVQQTKSICSDIQFFRYLFLLKMQVRVQVLFYLILSYVEDAGAGAPASGVVKWHSEVEFPSSEDDTFSGVSLQDLFFLHCSSIKLPFFSPKALTLTFSSLCVEGCFSPPNTSLFSYHPKPSKHFLIVSPIDTATVEHNCWLMAIQLAKSLCKGFRLFDGTLSSTQSSRVYLGWLVGVTLVLILLATLIWK